MHPSAHDYKDVVAASDRANRRFWRRDLVGYVLFVALAFAAAMFLPRAQHDGKPSAIDAPSAAQMESLRR